MAFIFYMNECRLPAEAARRIATWLRPKVGSDMGHGQPISLAGEDFLGIVVTPKLAVGARADFVGLARNAPTKLNFYAVPGVPYLACLAFQQRAGMSTTFVAYNNPAGGS